MTRPENTPDPKAPPEGWTPEAESDTRWEGMRELMAEADQPRVPTAGEFSHLRESIAAELREDPPRVLDRPRSSQRTTPPHSRPQSPARVLFMGGGIAGHAMRLAAVGAVAFLIGTQTTGRDAVRTEVVETSAVTTTEVATAPQQAPVTTPVAESVAEIVADAQLAGVSAAVTPVSGERIVRSIHDEGFHAPPHAAPNRTASLGGVVPVMAHDGEWFLYSHFGPSATGARSAARQDPAQLLETVQQIRVQASLLGDQATANKIRALEDALWPLLLEEDLVPRDDADKYAALEDADRLVASGRYDEAIDAYREVLSRGRGTVLASTAHFQLARVLFEEMRDYEAALAEYRALLEDYPHHYLTSEQREHVLGRIELLSRNYASNWMAVRLWQDIEQSSGHERRARLEELLQRAPQSPLASEAAGELARQAASGAYPERASVEQLIRTLDNALEQAGGSAHAAGLQFAIAELVLLRLYEQERAAEEYRRVLRLPGSNSYAERVRMRLAQLEQ